MPSPGTHSDRYLLVPISPNCRFLLTIHCACGHTSSFTGEEIFTPMKHITHDLKMRCQRPGCVIDVLTLLRKGDHILEIYAENYELKMRSAGKKRKRQKSKKRKTSRKPPIVERRHKF